jgi:hypothetical protein
MAAIPDGAVRATASGYQSFEAKTKHLLVSINKRCVSIDKLCVSSADNALSDKLLYCPRIFTLNPLLKTIYPDSPSFQHENHAL